jgi:hypothetical protein
LALRDPPTPRPLGNEKLEKRPTKIIFYCKIREKA